MVRRKGILTDAVSPIAVGQQDQQIERMKQSRSSAAVLKAKLATLRSEMPDGVIIAMEGKEDKAVYFQWINRVRAGYAYEPFPCGGKGQVLELFTALQRDLGDLKDDVFFVLDRDFDELRGHSPHPKIFMTDRYAIENYLVEDAVLEGVLRDHLHCEAQVATRKQVCELFNQVYDEFLNRISELNFTLYAAKRIGLRLSSGGAPGNGLDVVRIELSTCHKGHKDISEILTIERDLSEIELFDLGPEFATLHAKHRYRGKYSYEFFVKWLKLVVEDRVSDATHLFGAAGKPGKISASVISSSLFASMSPLPLGFEEFVGTLP